VPAHRSVLLRLDVRAAGRPCRCKRNHKHTIAKGDRRLVLKERGPGTPEHGYCAACAQEMLAQAEAQLAELRASLG
jgi:hypothetical protein